MQTRSGRCRRMFPANILKYDAASVPILQLGLSSKTLREQEIFDIGNNFIRTPLGTVQGASVSYPFGGKQRAVMVDLNLRNCTRSNFRRSMSRMP